MVNWKSGDSINRLIAVIIAANPGNKIDYNAVAALFGQGATYDSIEGQCRKYRRMADELRADAAEQGISIAGTPRGRGKIGTPRTPREAQNKVNKPSSASTTKGKTGVANRLTTPTRQGPKSQIGYNQIDTAMVENDDIYAGTNANGADAKPETMEIIPSIEETKFEPCPADNAGSFVGVVIPTKAEKVATKESIRFRRSEAPPQDSGSDEYVNSREGSLGVPRGRARTRRSLVNLATPKYAECDIGFEEEVA